MKTYKLFLLNLIPVALAALFFLSFGNLLLAAVALFVFVFINLKYSDKFWIALLAMLMSGGLTFGMTFLSTRLYYFYLNRFSETLLVGNILVNGMGIVAGICLFFVLLAGLLSE